jgi:hypothetical protein
MASVNPFIEKLLTLNFQFFNGKEKLNSVDVAKA